MPPTVLLSASPSDPDDLPGLPACDPSEMHEAVVQVAREIVAQGGRIVSGGHPRVTPLLLEVCRDLGRPDAVTIYQSERFRRDIPPSTWSISRAGWGALRFIASFSSRDRDLELMRLTMVTDAPLAGAVYIGGGGGVALEHELVRQMTYGVQQIALRAPGGTAAGLRCSEHTGVEVDSGAYAEVAQQISRAFGFR